MKKMLTVIMIGLLCLSTYSILAPRLRAESEVLQLPAGAYYANHGQTYATILQNINVANQGQIATVALGQTITIAYTLQIYCNMGPPPVPGEIRQAFFGYSWASSWPPWDAYTEVYNGIPGLYPGVTKSDSFTLQVPTSPGSYSVWFLGESQYSMQDAIAAHTSPPTALPHAIIIVTTTNRPSPVGYWKFDEGTGSIAHDSSGNGNDGTVNGASWTAGISNGALQFDGISNYVGISSSQSLTVSGNQISLELWMRPSVTLDDSLASRINIMDKGDEYGFQMDAGSGIINFYVVFGSGMQPIATTTRVWTAGSWYQIVGTYDGVNQNVYVNGVLENTKPLSGNLRAGGYCPLSIGSYCFGTMNFFNGAIDEVKIYNYARTAQEIQGDYQAGQVSLPWKDDFNYNSKEDMKVAGWRLDETSPGWMTLLPGIARFDNDGSSGSSAYFIGHFPSGVTDFSVEAKSRWVGRSVGDNGNVYVITSRHSYAWAGDGYYPNYMFVRDGVVVMRFDGYTPILDQWTVFTLEKRGNTFYMYQDGQLKNTYVETDAAPDELVGVGIGAGWVSTMEYDYISVENVQIQLAVTSAHDSPIPTGGSYTPGTSITASVTSPVAGSLGTQYVCTGWSGTGDVPATGTETTVTFTITQDSGITWNWKTQYYLTVDDGGHGTASGQGWYDAGTDASFSINPTLVSGGAGVQYLFTGWSSLDIGGYTGSAASNSVAMNNPITETANWKDQYYLTVTSPFDMSTGQGWYDSGSTAHSSVTSPIDGGTGKQYVAIGYAGTGSAPTSGSGTVVSFAITSPSSVTWNWKTQYYLTVKTDPPGVATIGGQGWYDENAAVTLTAPFVSGTYRFYGWDVDGTSQGRANPIVVHMSPHTATAHYSNSAVGGEWAPIDTVQLVTPWIALVFLAIAFAAAGSHRLLRKRL